METTQENLNILCLKNKLQTNLKLYLEKYNKPFNTLEMYINTLKTKYNKNINDIELFLQNIRSYTKDMRVEDWIFNWNNKCLINELNNFFDTTRNYELEEKINSLQKQINEIRLINIEQNNKIEIIEEEVKNTNKLLN
jgi:hypothetical protein